MFQLDNYQKDMKRIFKDAIHEQLLFFLWLSVLLLNGGVFIVLIYKFVIFNNKCLDYFMDSFPFSGYC